MLARRAFSKQKSIVLVDLPRTLPVVSQTGDIYSSLEQIKNGCFDVDKYFGEEVITEPPFVVVFSNSMPPQGAFTPGRVKFFFIVPLTKDIHECSSDEQESLFNDHTIFLYARKMFFNDPSGYASNYYDYLNNSTEETYYSDPKRKYYRRDAFTGNWEPAFFLKMLFEKYSPYFKNE
jgi:hypothetical protein